MHSHFLTFNVNAYSLPSGKQGEPGNKVNIGVII